jgi:hypothetical protein
VKKVMGSKLRNLLYEEQFIGEGMKPVLACAQVLAARGEEDGRR